MTTATTVYRNYATASLWGEMGFGHDRFAENSPAAPRRSREERSGRAARSSTILGRFALSLDVDLADRPAAVPEASPPELLCETPLFVPTEPLAVRRVRFRIVKRSAWQPNPILPDEGA